MISFCYPLLGEYRGGDSGILTENGFVKLS